MSKSIYSLILAGLCTVGLDLSAANTASQTITFSVNAITEVAVSGDPPALTATSAQAGTDPADVTDSSTFYALTTNGSAEKLTVSLSAPMPTGTILYVQLEAPDGGHCMGDICLDTSCQNAVCGITQVAQSNLQIYYLFQSTINAGVIPITSRVVTFTLAP